MEDDLRTTILDLFRQAPLARLNEYVWRMNGMFYADIAGLQYANGDAMITRYRSAIGELMGIPIEITDVPELMLVNERDEIEQRDRMPLKGRQ